MVEKSRPTLPRYYTSWFFVWAGVVGVRLVAFVATTECASGQVISGLVSRLLVLPGVSGLDDPLSQRSGDSTAGVRPVLIVRAHCVAAISTTLTPLVRYKPESRRRLDTFTIPL
jgi:hypothetical protein